MRLRNVLVPVVLVVALAGAGYGAWRTFEPKPAPPLPPPILVHTVPATRQDVPVWLSGLGTVQALNTVVVRSRVDGQIQQIAYTEGQEVQEGQLLVQIDPRPFQAALAQAYAQRARDIAQLANAQLDVQRSSQLIPQGFAPRQQLDTQRANVAVLQAALAGDQAAIDNAQVQLAYAGIVSPIHGRTGVRLVDVGNMVRANDAAGLVVITQLEPIAATFSLPQDELPRVNRSSAASPTPLAVEALARDGSVLARGEMLLVDNQIEADTGTLKVKAVFPNTDRLLWPGQFLSARLLVETRTGAVTVPQTALQRGQDGQFVFVVGADNKAVVHKVKTGPEWQGMVTIAEGVADGDRVVVDGSYRLHDGSEVREQPPASAPAGPAAARPVATGTDGPPAGTPRRS